MGFDTILGLQPRDKVAMLLVIAKWCLAPRDRSQRRETLLFLVTNMDAVMSHAKRAIH